MNPSLKSICVLFIMCLLASCQTENILPQASESPVLPDTPYDYLKVLDEVEEFVLPGEIAINLPNDPFNNFEGCINCEFPPFLSSTNTITSNEIATLGRVLFYDKKMSRNNSISCASCHKQNLAFADGEVLSEGFGGKMTSRNSMSIANPILHTSFFWDGRSHSLEDLALRPVQNHIEMGMEDINELVNKLKAEPYYSDLFKRAYGSIEITDNKLAQALAEFVSSIFKRDSKFDEGLANEFKDMSELEKHGMAIFFSQETQCASCHSGANFTAPSGFDSPYQETAGTANIGLNTVYDDNGFGQGKFKIPSLRNVTLTGPYMHDGRFETLREVLDHYNKGINPHQELDVKFLKGGSPVRMGLSDLDLDALEAFLGTLTSKSITTDEKYSNPFRT